MLSGARVRRLWVVWGVLLGGCATSSMTTTAHRVLLGPSPMAPQAMAGATGFGLGAQVMAGSVTSSSDGSGVAFAQLMPTAGGVLKVRDWYFGGHFSLASGAFGSTRASSQSATVGPEQVAAELSLLVGRDVPFTPAVGLTVSGELGASFGSLRVTSAGSTGTVPTLYPALRGGLGVYALPFGPLRFFAGATVDTTPWNPPTSTITATCTGVCSYDDDGRAGFTAVGLAGGGLRLQANEYVSFTLEAWMPFTRASAVLPLQVSFTVRVGDFDLTPKRKSAPLTPPPLLQGV